jgi:cytochrome c2
VERESNHLHFGLLSKILPPPPIAVASYSEANRLNDRAVALRVANSKLDLRIVQLDRTTKSLLQDMKKVGPNLKDVRLKLNKNWIPVWLKKPTDFRPTTRMPNFRLNDEQIQAISAYLWQSALPDAPVKHAPGNAGRGKELFETRGCLGCHSIGEGAQMQGGTFAANLTRVGEKANYDYLVRWVHNARQRTRPYCQYEKKDIGPEDYAKKGLPYVFDLQHSKCPNDGHELQVQNMTVMPSLRLTEQDASDVASYLVTLKKKEPSSYPDAAFMDEILKPAYRQTFIAQPSMKTFHPRILRRLARLYMDQLDLSLHTPRQKIPAAPGSFVHTPPHRVQNPKPTPGSPKSAPPAAFPRARNASASSAGLSARPRDTPDAPACGSHALPHGPVKHAAADTRTVAWTAPTPPAACAAARPCALFGSDNSTPPSSSPGTLAVH